MLKGITWGQFSVFIMVVTGVYYLYVVGRYYRAEVLGRVTGKRGLAREATTMATDEDKKENNRERDATADQGELSKRGEPVGGRDEPFQVMQRAMAVIRQVITQGVENKLDRENLLDHIREVLGDYRQLRKTEYADTINNFLIRVCSSELSVDLGEGELAALWK